MQEKLLSLELCIRPNLHVNIVCSNMNHFRRLGQLSPMLVFQQLTVYNMTLRRILNVRNVIRLKVMHP